MVVWCQDCYQYYAQDKIGCPRGHSTTAPRTFEIAQLALLKSILDSLAIGRSS